MNRENGEEKNVSDEKRTFTVMWTEVVTYRGHVEAASIESVTLDEIMDIEAIDSDGMDNITIENPDEGGPE